MYFIIAGLILIGAVVGINLISSDFDKQINIIDQPVIEFVSLYIVTGLVYFIYIYRIKNFRPKIKNVIIWIFIIGIIARLVMILSVPILEVDFYRYMWDGAVTVSGSNPYKYSPKNLLNDNNNASKELKELALKNENILKRINHPELKTSYPLVAQAVFAITNLIKPFSLSAWKFVLLFIDIIIFILIYILLKKLKLPESNLIIYWWNPILIKEVFNSGHMDVLVFPFLLGSMLLYLSNRYLFSFTTLTAAVGIKLWPVLLFPVFIRKFISDWKKLLQYFLIFSVLSILILLPLFISYFDTGSGIEAYSRSWQNNESFFRIVLAISEFILPLIGYHPGHGQSVSRIIVGILAIILVLYLIRNKIKNELDYFRIGLAIIAITFFISPTQFPWYYIWMLPFLTFIPYKPLLLLTVLMPLYYLRYYYEPRGEYDFYYQYIVWLEYLPALVWLGYDLISKKFMNRSTA